WAIQRGLLRTDFPFVLGRQAGARPAGECVGFESADVADRFFCREGTDTGEREQVPAALRRDPVKRRAPALRPHLLPTLAEPELGSPIPAVLNEFQVLAAGDESSRQLESLQEGPMPRSFDVEGEGVPFVADEGNARLEADPPCGPTAMPV